MPSLNLSIDTRCDATYQHSRDTPHIERISCLWRESAAFLGHEWYWDGTMWERQLTLTRSEIARMEALIRSTELMPAIDDMSLCHLRLVDAAGNELQGSPRDTNEWFIWADTMRERVGEDWTDQQTVDSPQPRRRAFRALPHR